MAWDIRRTYYYLVCFATLLMVIIGGVQTVRNALDLALPNEPYAPSPYEIEMRYARPAPPGEAPAPSVYTREELETMAAEERDRSLRQQRRNDLRDLLGGLALMLIAAPVYAYHWRRVRSLEAQEP